MPRTTSTRQKRALQDADGASLNAEPTRNSKKAKVTSSDGTENVKTSVANDQSQTTEEPFETPRGPDGSLVMPTIIPMEGKAGVDAEVLLPGTSVDATPGRELTLGDLHWRQEYYEWIKKNHKKLDGQTYVWVDSPDCSILSGSKDSYQRTYINFTTSPSEQEKLAVANFDKDQNGDKPEEEPKVIRLQGKKATDWICLCRPSWDIDAELPISSGSMENDDDPEEIAKENEEYRRLHGCPRNDHKDGCLSTEFPGHKWVFSKRSIDWVAFFVAEQNKRCQDVFDSHMYNDWNGYGTIEALENQLFHFDKHFAKAKNPDIFLAWAHAETLSYIFHNGIEEITGVDDGSRVEDFVKLHGALITSLVNFLITKDEFKEDSILPNLNVVLALWIKYGVGLEDFDTPWVNILVRLADEHNVRIEGCFGIEDILKGLREDASHEDRASESSNNMTFKRRWGWNKQLKSYSDEHRDGKRIGGTHYDFTRRPKSFRGYGDGDVDDADVDADADGDGDVFVI